MFLPINVLEDPMKLVDMFCNKQVFRIRVYDIPNNTIIDYANAQPMHTPYIRTARIFEDKPSTAKLSVDYKSDINKYIRDCYSAVSLLDMAVQIMFEYNEPVVEKRRLYADDNIKAPDTGKLSTAYYQDLFRKRTEILGCVRYTWRDIVKINGKVYCEEFPISGKKDAEDIYQIDDFIEAVAKKHGVDTDDVETLTMNNNLDIGDIKDLEYGIEKCGCYINGIAEWLLPVKM
jgi:hypothetical protein